MSDFEKLKEEAERIEEEELYKEEEQMEEEKQLDEEYIESLKHMPLEQVLYQLGLLGAHLKKAPNPDAFARTYAQSTAAILKLIGFQSALAETLGTIMLDPKKRFFLGIAVIVGGLVLTPANVSVLQGGNQT